MFIDDLSPPCALPPEIRLSEFQTRFVGGVEVQVREAFVPPRWIGAVFKSFRGPNRAAWLSRGYAALYYGKVLRIKQTVHRLADGSFALTRAGIDAIQKEACRQEELAIPIDIPAAIPPPDLSPLGYGIEDLLKDYQIQPARQILRALVCGPDEWGRSGAWDQSDLGTGKSYQTLAAAIALGLEIVVICPRSTIGRYPNRYTGKGGDGWLAAFAHFKQHPRLVINYEALKTGKRDWLSIVTVNGKRKYRWNFDPKHTVFIFDEAHRCKNPMSKETAMLLAAVSQGFPVILASGTMAFTPLDMYATGQVIGLHKGGKDYVRFLAEHGCTGPMETKEGERWGTGWKVVDDDRNKLHMQRIHRVVDPMRGARVRKADLGDKFPDSIVEAIAIDTEDTQQIAQAFERALQTIRELRDRADLNDEQADRLRGNAWQNAWHESERLKVPEVVRRAREAVSDGCSAVIFVNFTDVREEISRQLKCRCQVYGTQDISHRQNCITAFAEDRERIIILNAAAGGTGVNLQDRNGDHPRVSLIMPPVRPDILGQVLGRTPRQGGLTVCKQYILYAKDTVEEGICDNVRAKLGDLSALTDGDLNPAAIF